MEKQSEQVTKLDEVGQQLDNALAIITKVGAETDGLTAEIERLNQVIGGLGDMATQELIDAVTRVNAKAFAVSNAIKVVDEKVPDAPAATPTDETPAP